MPSDRLKQVFKQEVSELHETGIAKGKENIVGWFSTFREAHLATRERKQQIYKEVLQTLVRA